MNQPPAQFIAPLNGANLVDHRVQLNQITGFAPLGNPTPTTPGPVSYAAQFIARPASTFTTLESSLLNDNKPDQLIPAYNIYPDQAPKPTHHTSPIIGTLILAGFIFIAITGITFVYAVGLGIFDLGDSPLKAMLNPIIQVLPLLPQ